MRCASSPSMSIKERAQRRCLEKGPRISIHHFFISLMLWLLFKVFHMITQPKIYKYAYLVRRRLKTTSPEQPTTPFRSIFISTAMARFSILRQTIRKKKPTPHNEQNRRFVWKKRRRREGFRRTKLETLQTKGPNMAKSSTVSGEWFVKNTKAVRA